MKIEFLPLIPRENESGSRCGWWEKRCPRLSRGFLPQRLERRGRRRRRIKTFRWKLTTRVPQEFLRRGFRRPSIVVSRLRSVAILAGGSAVGHPVHGRGCVRRESHVIVRPLLLIERLRSGWCRHVLLTTTANRFPPSVLGDEVHQRDDKAREHREAANSTAHNRTDVGAVIIAVAAVGPTSFSTGCRCSRRSGRRSWGYNLARIADRDGCEERRWTTSQRGHAHNPLICPAGRRSRV